MPQVSVTPLMYRRIANIAGFLGVSTEKQVCYALEEWLESQGAAMIDTMEMNRKHTRRKRSDIPDPAKVKPFCRQPLSPPSDPPFSDPDLSPLAATGSM